MIDLKTISMFADNINELDTKYAKPMEEYCEKLKLKIGGSPTPQQKNDYETAYNKHVLLSNLVINARKVNAMLAVTQGYIEELKNTVEAKRIYKDGHIRETLVSEQRKALQDCIEKIISAINEE